MQHLRPKKNLGQHFLTDLDVARKITELLTGEGYRQVLEIGPGTGALTNFLREDSRFKTSVIDVDRELIARLRAQQILPETQILEGDFLRFNFPARFEGPVGLIGNLPYNISSQIFFRLLELREQIPELVCMVQKEVGERIASPPGSKKYGILSVFMQAFYQVEAAFIVPPHVFNPPPKVQSVVLRCRRNGRKTLDCNEKMFFSVVKTAFNQRRKTLRNALKPMGSGRITEDLPVLHQRAEQLSVTDFEALSRLMETIKNAG